MLNGRKVNPFLHILKKFNRFKKSEMSIIHCGNWINKQVEAVCSNVIDTKQSDQKCQNADYQVTEDCVKLVSNTIWAKLKYHFCYQIEKSPKLGFAFIHHTDN
jgi:hypothetical protein